MRLGVYGGTFDPIHLAHLRCAEEAREMLGLDRVLFVPAAVPPHKGDRAVTSATHRLRMVRAAIAGNPAFRVSSIEIDRAGRSYSVDTLRLLHRRSPASVRFVFLLGSDAFREITTWKEYLALFELADIAVMSRPGHVLSRPRSLIPVAARGQFCYSPERTRLLHRSGNCVRFLNVTALAISASAIRQRVGRGESIRYLVPASVERYIQRHRLYLGRSRSS